MCALKMEAECGGAQFCGSGNHCGCDYNTCERCSCCLNCPKERDEYKGPACSQCPELCSNCTFACPNCSGGCEDCGLVRCCTGIDSSGKKCSGFKCFNVRSMVILFVMVAINVQNVLMVVELMKIFFVLLVGNNLYLKKLSCSNNKQKK